MTTLDTLKQARDALKYSNAQIMKHAQWYGKWGNKLPDISAALPPAGDVRTMEHNDECIALLNAEIARLEEEVKDEKERLSRMEEYVKRRILRST